MSCRPHLVMVIEPENKVRFRYRSEGGSHGGLLGKQKGKGKKVYPTVKLQGYNGDNRVYIRVSLYTEDKKPHVLEFILSGASEEFVPHIDEYVQEDNTAVFTNLRFLSKKKEEIYQQLLDEKMGQYGETRKCVRKTFEQKYSKELKDRAKNIMNSVRLRFEAFEETNSRSHTRLCEPLFSELICNQKAASKGELRIHRMSGVSGSWKGGDEIILLCDKVQKENIEIIFYETDDEYGEAEDITWEGNAIFKPADVHYQYAITFRTPQYKTNAEKKVFVCLARNGERSKPVQFTYIPDFEENPCKKRKIYSKEEPFVPILIASPGNSSNPNSNDSAESLLSEQPEDDVSIYFPNGDLFKELGIDMDDLGSDGQEVLNALYDESLFPEAYVPMDECVPAINNHERIVNQSLAVQFIDFTQVDGPLFSTEKYSFPSVKQKFINKIKPRQHSNKEQIQQKVYSLLMKKDDSGNTLLHTAVYKNKGVEFIIKMNEFANTQFINLKNYDQKTPLHIATEQNIKEVVKILLKCDGNPNLKNSDGNNCYHLASKGNYIDVLCYLLTLVTCKPELNAFNYEGLTPLHIAVMKNSKDCFRLLKLHSAEINILDQKSGRSLLHYAVEFQPSFVTVLLEEGDINVNIQDYEGNTPLHLACSNGNINIIKQLLKAGADPLLKNFKSKVQDEEISEDDVFGQTPGDCTSNSEILGILQTSVNAQDSSDCIEELCSLLDHNMKWKEVALYVMDEEYITSLECSTNPSKTLLQHMQKEQKEDFLDKLQSIINLTGPDEALDLIKKRHS